MKVWRTSPGSATHRAATGASGDASPAAQAASRHGVDGNSVMPPSNPRGGRGRTRTAPSSRSAQNTTPQRVGLAAAGAIRGKASATPATRAAQPVRQGQEGQSGRRGVHTVAPRSISAWAKSPGRPGAARAAASRVIPPRAAGSGVSMACSRASTRTTLPSTGTAGRSNAIAAIAAAV